MAWSVPRTWSPGEMVTAALMNAHVRDNMNVIASSKALEIKIGAPDAVIGTGVDTIVEVPFDCTILGWSLVSITAGASIVLDVWRAASPTIPTVAETIAGNEKPTLSAAQYATDQDLSTWDVDLVAGDLLAINVDSATAEGVTLILHLEVA